MKKNGKSNNKLLIWGLILTVTGIFSALGIIFLMIFAAQKGIEIKEALDYDAEKRLRENLKKDNSDKNKNTKININDFQEFFKYRVDMNFNSNVNKTSSSVNNQNQTTENKTNTQVPKTPEYKYSNKEILNKIKYYDNKVLSDEGIIEKIEILKDMMSSMVDKIENQVLVNDVKDICKVIDKILVKLKENNSKVKEVNNFTNYYLPVTLKILIKYDEVENLNLKTDNSKEFLGTVEEKIKLIKDAFNKQLESLYEDDFSDIEAELTVLEGMLKTDGYTDIEDFNIKRKRK